MDSLDNIWDVDAEEEPRNHASRASSSQPQQPLFLPDHDSDDAPNTPPKVPQASGAIDAMFDDVDDADDPFNYQPLTFKLDPEALRREAEARHKRNMPALTPHPIMSSSPPRETGDGDEPSKSKTAGDDKTKGKDGKKERKKPMRLDEGRLLGPAGFPKLIKDTKNFRIKGKGHEVTDLNRLLQVYGYWTHELYPKTIFRDTVERVEKLCHSRRMHVSLSVWRDEAHGYDNRHKPEDDLIDLIGEPRTANNGSSRSSSLVSDGAAYASSSSHPPSRPPSSGTELDDEDFGMDAAIQDEEERVEREKAGHTTSLSSQYLSNAMPDDEEAMWKALDDPQPSITVSEENADEDMWELMDELETTASDTIPVQKSTIQHRGEDHEMSNLNTADTQHLPAPAPAPQDDEDDWDSIYV